MSIRLALWLPSLLLGLGIVSACSDDDDDDAPPPADDDDDDDDDDDTVPEACALVDGDCPPGQHLEDPDLPECACRDNATLSQEARQELLAAGLDRYFGAFTPIAETPADGYTVYDFGADPDGPICLRGDAFSLSVRDTGSDNLLIFLQGGGACWTGFCQATVTANSALVAAGLLDGDAARNPVGDWNVVFVPYCDGSVFSGDNEVVEGEGEEARLRYHHGLANFSAALDLAHALFPNPKKVLLAGSSAGGFGTILGTAVTRLQYPDPEFYVFNDAGPGVQNLDEMGDVEARLADWQYGQFIPASCQTCDGGRGQLSEVIGWGLANDPGLRVAMFSAYEDGVIGNAFLKLEGPAFKALLLSETDKVDQAASDRFNRFFIEGTQHTGLQISFYSEAPNQSFDGLTLADFAGQLVGNDPEWTDHLK